MSGTASWKPVSVRLLIPELDAALAVSGRIVDWLHSCYGSVYTVGGRPVQYEYYFTDSTESYFDSRLPLGFWDQPDGWWFDCRTFKYATDGRNPCGPGPRVPTAFPATWERPELLAGSCPDSVLAADKYGNTLWWH